MLAFSVTEGRPTLRDFRRVGISKRPSASPQTQVGKIISRIYPQSRRGFRGEEKLIVPSRQATNARVDQSGV
jgi:hypothetical protein